jgi:hypothetical protein
LGPRDKPKGDKGWIMETVSQQPFRELCAPVPYEADQVEEHQAPWNSKH